MSYAQSAQITFSNMLGTLDHLARKAEEAGLAGDVLATRLTEDMFPLELQFRVAINQVLLALNQVGRKAVPLEETTFEWFAHIRERIATIRAQLDQSASLEWAEADAVVDLTLPNGVRFLMLAEQDIRDWIVLNFYFHVTMAYALLRNAGLAIGKMDFLPHMERYKVEGA